MLTLSDQRQTKAKAMVYTDAPSLPVIPSWAQELVEPGAQLFSHKHPPVDELSIPA